MAKLTCASCETRGEVDLRPGEGAFDIRGRWPDGNRPVVKCNSCEHGLVVQPRFDFMIWWPKTLVIPEETWRRMQRQWREQVELRCRQCGKTFTTERSLQDHMTAKHGLDSLGEQPRA